MFAQNVETVSRLTHPVRDPRAGYEQTIGVLREAKTHRPPVLTKTSLMLGLGETDAEIHETMMDLRAAAVDILTLGQYLRPTPNHLNVERFVTPAEFDPVPRPGVGAGISGVRVRPVGAVELSRGAGAGAQQCRPQQRSGPGARRGKPPIMSDLPLIRHLGLAPYEPTWRAMQVFTDERETSTPDEIWFVEHPPVFTLGIEREPRAFVTPGRHPGGANRPRRSGDVSRSRAAGRLSAH